MSEWLIYSLLCCFTYYMLATLVGEEMGRLRYLATTFVISVSTNIQEKERERGGGGKKRSNIKSNCKYKSHMGMVNFALNSIYLLEVI